MAFLVNRDMELHEIIASIRDEELAHLNHAEAQLESAQSIKPHLRRAISVVTEILIWLSTWGDSTRMLRALAAKS